MPANTGSGDNTKGTLAKDYDKSGYGGKNHEASKKALEIVEKSMNEDNAPPESTDKSKAKK